MVERADFSVQQSERDIVLAEPALYIEEKGEYVTQSYQYLFLPGGTYRHSSRILQPSSRQARNSCQPESFRGDSK